MKKLIIICNVFFFISACGYMDISDRELRRIVKIGKQILFETEGNQQCKETGRKTVHVDVHLSARERRNLVDLDCTSSPTALTCEADSCSCATTGEKNSDDLHVAECTGEDDIETTFTYTDEEVETYAEEAGGGDDGGGDDSGGDDGGNGGGDDSGGGATVPVGVCQEEGEQTIEFGELLGLETDDPILEEENILIGTTCSSKEEGVFRIIACAGDLCSCTAKFKLDVVPNRVECTQL